MQKHELLQRLFLLAILTAFSFSCKSSPTGPHIGKNLQLSSDYATCTEVWLKVAYSGQPSVVSGGEFKITRDGDTVLTGNLTGSDTTVIDTTAQPEQAYTYKAYRYTRNQVSDTSMGIQVTTMDSTSHDFSWRVFQFGGAASSYLYDVSIVNDSDVWAVGAIYVDSANGNPDPYEYNLIRWDGNEWNQYRIYYPGTNVLSPMHSVLAFDSKDAWIASTEPLHWNGSVWVAYGLTSSVFSGYTEKFWGLDSSDLYMAGDRGGSVARYDGYTWQKIPSATTLPIQDIWGSVDQRTGKEDVVAVASDPATPDGMEVLSVTPTSATPLNSAGLPWSLHSIWSPDTRLYYICGDGIYKNYTMNDSWKKNPYQATQYTERIRGNGVNDFVIVGDVGLLVHYNGSTFKEYNGNELPNIPGEYYSVDMKWNMIVAVGWLGTGQAIVVMGKR